MTESDIEEQDLGKKNVEKTLIMESSLTQKLPMFWQSMPDLWFFRVEANFRSAKVTSDQSKFDYILPALSEAVMLSVADILRNPPATEKYQKLKDALIQRHSESDEKKLEKLLNYIDIGDEKPSSFYRNMTAQTSSLQVGEELIKKIWLQRLPGNVKSVLSVVEDQEISKLMSLADKVWEQTRPGQVSETAISSNMGANDSQSEKQWAMVVNQINQLTKRFDKFSKNERSRSRSRERSGFSHSNAKTKVEKLCFFHKRFGSKARKCQQPCIHFKADSEN